MIEIDTKLREALMDAHEQVIGLRPWMNYAEDMINTLAKNPELVAAWVKVFADHDPGALPLDFPDKTPAEILWGDGTALSTAPQMALRPSKFYPLTRAQVNALVESAQLTGNWRTPTAATWRVLKELGYVHKNFPHATSDGLEWLKAAGLLPKEQSA